MNYEDFLACIKQELHKTFGNKAQILLRQVIKNNNVEKDALIIRTKESNCSPAIYMDGYYQAYNEGTAIEDLVRRLLEDYAFHAGLGETLPDDFFAWEHASAGIVCRLINTEKNKKRLEDIPHRTFLNLSVIYYYELHPIKDKSGGILIRNQYMDFWGISLEQLDECARRNTFSAMPYSFCSMHDMMEQLLQTKIPMDPVEDEHPLYVLTNEDHFYGAYWMSEPAILEEIRAILKADYYILPSSVHECMIVPVAVSVDADVLFEMVCDINASVIEPEIFLADAVYRYSMKRLEICRLCL